MGHRELHSRGSTLSFRALPVQYKTRKREQPPRPSAIIARPHHLLQAPSRLQLFTSNRRSLRGRIAPTWAGNSRTEPSPIRLILPSFRLSVSYSVNLQVLRPRLGGRTEERDGERREESEKGRKDEGKGKKKNETHRSPRGTVTCSHSRRAEAPSEVSRLVSVADSRTQDSTVMR